ncbi:MAG: methionine--tRNA ligase [Armatimonadetes bacterium CP1_7O]|jgi:methionyl-tRNA synthetase|nr:MAG: methionine--tRNA ligase [Armatimonadetes bacterium CP1_7O]
MKRYYITTPIYYVNSAPHIGTALTTIVADACARFHKRRGRAVYFLTGTDENAPKVHRVAQERGVPTQQFVDEMAEVFRNTWRQLHIEYDVFIRTTEERHKRVVAEVFRRLRDQGDIYKGSYQGWYCIACETFFASSKVGDSRTCPDCGKPLEWRDEPCYYFRLSAYESRLREHIVAHPQFIQPEVRRNETLGFINEGLQDVAVSRSGADWGVPVPDDPESGVVYVWFDALLNYLTATGWLERGDAYRDTWPPELQLMGKDILPRFHATIWPAMLMALGLPLPERLYGHGWWIVNKQKMSKSLGNVYAPLDVAQALASASGCALPYAVDAFRYYMLREMPTDADAEFSLEGFEARYNGDLANDLGNLLHRTLSMMHRYFGGRVPDGARLDAALADLFAQQAARTTEAYEAVDFPQGLREAWQIISAVNRYYDEQAPWTLMKQNNAERAGQVLYAGLIAARALCVLVEPVMPRVAREIACQLNIGEIPNWNEATATNAFPAGHTLQEPKPIFPRLQPKSGADTSARASNSDKTVQTTPNTTMQDLITIDEFKRLQIRIATVKAAEPVPKSTKLLKLTLDVGGEERTIVAGIAEDYTPEQVVGKQIPVLVNLQPALIRGIVSEGMMLAADVDGKAVLLHPDREVPSGSTVR